MSEKTDWRQHGVRVVKGSELDTNTAQTPGMNRAAAITHARAGAQKLWAGTVTIHANAKTGAHHHGEVESVIYVVKGKARSPAISSTCRPSCRTRRSTPAPTRPWNACCAAAARSRSSSTSTSRPSSRPRKCAGSTRSTANSADRMPRSPASERPDMTTENIGPVRRP